MPFVPYTSGSRTATRALEQFDEGLKGALAIADPSEMWAAQHGLVLSTDALKTTFPIPLYAAGYNEFKGDIKYRSLYMRAISIFNDKTWQDGVEELASIVELPDFIGWNDQPQAMAREWSRLPNTLVATVLEANPSLELYRDPDTGTLTTRALFADAHPCNVLDTAAGTFDNDRQTTQAELLNGTFFNDLKKYASTIKGPNGQYMGLSGAGATILCNPNREQLVDEATKQDQIIKAVSNAGVIAPPGSPGTVAAAVAQRNRHLGTVSYQRCDELTTSSDDYLYVILAGNPALHPWVVMQEAAPEVIICDKSDAKYKTSLKISYSAHGMAKAAALMPHRIVRYQITA